jgi:hypothetical protein
MRNFKILTIVVLAVGVSACGKFFETEKPEPIAKSQRYQIVFNPSVRADTFMLDTQKGKVWRLTQLTDIEGQPTVWVPMNAIDDTGEIGETYKDFFASNRLIRKK